jgi:hypothetical protein
MSATIQSIPKVNKQIKEKKVYDLEKYILNPETGRYVKIGGKVHQKMTGGLKEPKKHATIKTSENSVINPETGKLVLIDGRAYKKFMGNQTVKPGMVKIAGLKSMVRLTKRHKTKVLNFQKKRHQNLQLKIQWCHCKKTYNNN